MISGTSGDCASDSIRSLPASRKIRVQRTGDGGKLPAYVFQRNAVIRQRLKLFPRRESQFFAVIRQIVEDDNADMLVFFQTQRHHRPQHPAFIDCL